MIHIQGTRDILYSTRGKMVSGYSTYSVTIGKFQKLYYLGELGADGEMLNPANGPDRSMNIIVNCIQLAGDWILRSYGNA